MSNDRITKALILAQQRLRRLALAADFDPMTPGSRPTEDQQKIINYLNNDSLSIYAILGGNRSGKSQISRRILATMLREDAEAEWHRPERWKGPLTFVYCCKNHKQALGDFLPKFLQFFDEGELRVIKQAGQALFSIEHKTNGNRIFFIVHEAVEQARERVQAFSAHACFVDEMPRGMGAVRFLEELQARTTDVRGYLIMSFTPKSISRDVKMWVEGLHLPLGRKFSLKFLDNPIMTDEAKAQRLDAISNQSAAYQKTLLEGAWMTADNSVFNVPEIAFQGPPSYSPAWRHVCGVDPAASSALGIVVAAEEPSTGKWYVIKTDYFEKLQDVDLCVSKVKEYCAGLNLVRTVYDGATDWWFYHARKNGIQNLICPYDKNNRKDEMITRLQLGFGRNLFIAPWCETVIDELNSMSWSATVEGKIANNSRYHTADALRYMYDCLPKTEANCVRNQSYAAHLIEGHEKRKLEKKLHKGDTFRDKPFVGTITRRNRIW